MVAIPPIKDEDGKRPNRERESLVGEQSRIINRIKATLVRLGIRGFNAKLKKAAERLEGLRTPEGEPIPPNTLSELYRDMERRRLVRDQIRQIESARLDRLEHAPSEGAHAMVRLLARVMGPSESGFSWSKKKHSRDFSIFRVFTQPRSFASRSAKSDDRSTSASPGKRPFKA